MRTVTRDEQYEMLCEQAMGEIFNEGRIEPEWDGPRPADYDPEEEDGFWKSYNTDKKRDALYKQYRTKLEKLLDERERLKEEYRVGNIPFIQYSKAVRAPGQLAKDYEPHFRTAGYVRLKGQGYSGLDFVKKKVAEEDSEENSKSVRLSDHRTDKGKEEKIREERRAFKALQSVRKNPDLPYYEQREDFDKRFQDAYYEYQQAKVDLYGPESLA